MESDTRLFRVYIINTKKIIMVRKEDFKFTRKDSLLEVSALLHGISSKIVGEEKQGNIEKSEQQLINSFTPISTGRPLMDNISRNNEEFDPKVPSPFDEACEYP